MLGVQIFFENSFIRVFGFYSIDSVLSAARDAFEGSFDAEFPALQDVHRESWRDFHGTFSIAKTYNSKLQISTGKVSGHLVELEILRRMRC